SNTIDLKLTRTDKFMRLHTLNLELGLDHYTSASSDSIDPHTLSSASSADTRFYPSAAYSIRNPKNGFTYGGSLSFSSEYDYTSIGAGIQLAKSSKDNNRELSANLQAYIDRWKVILPIELRDYTQEGSNEGYKPRNSYSASFTYSQVINPKLQLALIMDLITQQGLLSTPFHRVYLDTHEVTTEKLPDSRFKVPVAIRANYFMTDRIILRSYYRFYSDNWGMRSNTFNLEMPVKITPYFSLTPFYRFYNQGAATYFAGKFEHDATDVYHTSDYDLSKFHSHFEGIGLRYLPEHGVFNWHLLNTVEVRYGHYNRSTGLTSNILTLDAKFKL
ncbi:MAG TPA: DUF3570 domain-containing protein, partial [Flavitalea sp.]|nr:DUF3570 domain-containing protein [Flavitalea sp.]